MIPVFKQSCETSTRVEMKPQFRILRHLAIFPGNFTAQGINEYGRPTKVLGKLPSTLIALPSTGF